MRRFTALLTVLLLALAPACGTASAQEVIAQAPAKTQDAGSARMSMKMDMTGGPQDVSITADGAMDFEAKTMSMTMDLGAMGAQAGMSKIDMVSQGTTIFMKFPNYEQLGLPTAWVKMDLEKMAGMQGMESLSQMNNNDPSKSMEMLRGVSEDVEEVGSEEIRGTETTHYKATINIDKALEEMPEEARKSFEKQFKTMGIDTIPTEVWVDGDGLLRRQKITMDLSKAKGAAAAGGQAPTSAVVDMEFYDFGADVNVSPPPADEVTDFNKIQGG